MRHIAKILEGIGQGHREKLTARQREILTDAIAAAQAVVEGQIPPKEGKHLIGGSDLIHTLTKVLIGSEHMPVWQRFLDLLVAEDYFIDHNGSAWPLDLIKQWRHKVETVNDTDGYPTRKVTFSMIQTGDVWPTEEDHCKIEGLRLGTSRDKRLPTTPSEAKREWDNEDTVEH